MKTKEHLITVKVRFDRAITRSAAVRAARNRFDPVGVEAYATIAEEELDGWSTMKVKSVQSHKETARR